MVIRHDDEWPAELEDVLDDLVERYLALDTLDDPEQLETAAEALYADVAAVEYPQLMLMVLAALYSSQYDRDAGAESLGTYLRMNRIIVKHRDAIDPTIAENMQMLIVIAAGTLAQMPDVPLSRIIALLDTAEQQVRAAGDPLDNVLLSRGVVAALCGDVDGARTYREQWRAAEPYSSPVPRTAALQMDAIIALTYDAELALEIVERFMPYDALEEKHAIMLQAHRAYSLALVGRAQEAEREAVAVMLQHDPELVRTRSTHLYLLRALEGNPTLANAVLGWISNDLTEDAAASEYETQAVAARYLLRSPETRERGMAMRELALRNAALFDARNGNTFVTDTAVRDHLTA